MFFLKLFVKSDCLIHSGREFQSVGADVEKALLPYYFSLHVGTCSRHLDEERIFLGGI
jgi:hypothetical protein